MRVLVTGASGQLGYDVLAELRRRGHEAVGAARSPDGADSGVALDITDASAVERVIARVSPQAVLHCAAWTAVDAAQEEQAYEAVRAVNTAGTAYIARACRKRDCKLLYVSTDYVFDGRGTAPWQPDCTEYAPLNVYGRTKLAGEQAVRAALEKYFIVRTAWVFGAHGGNFVKTMLRLGESHESLRVVDDQIGAPTYTRDLARLLCDMIETERYGVYHATNEGGYVSWYEFAGEILRQAGLPTRLIPVSTEEYGLSRAARPRNSRLDTGKLAQSGFAPLPPWQDALRRFLAEIGYGTE